MEKYTTSTLTPVPSNCAVIETPFDNSEVCSILGLPPAQIAFLVNYGMLKKSVLNCSRPISNFAFPNVFDIVQCCLVAKIFTVKFDIMIASQVAAICVDSLAFLVLEDRGKDPRPTVDRHMLPLLSNALCFELSDGDFGSLGNILANPSDWNCTVRYLARETGICWNYCVRRAAEIHPEFGGELR